jgi:phosphoglycolate phosphatase
MQLVRPKAILFDWDNTLVESWEKLRLALNSTYAEFGLPEQSLDEIKHTVHHSLQDSFPSIFGSNWENAKKAYYKHYQITYAHINSAPLVGARETLEYLINSGIYVAIVSNKRGEILRQEVEALNWGKYFKQIVGSLDAQRDKPFPDPVYLALNGYKNELNSDAWFVGDSTVDIQFAHNTKLEPILIGDKIAAQDVIKNQMHHHYVANHPQFLGLISSLN